MDKSRQEKLELRRKQEDAQLNKLLIWFAAAFVFEAVVLFIKRFFINYNQTSITELKLALGLSKVLMVLQYVAPILAIAAAVWYLLRRRKGVSGKLPMVLFGVGAALSVTAIAVYNSRSTGMTFVSVLPPVIAVLALIYFLYQREFFFSAILSGLGIFSLWFYRKAFAGRPVMVSVVFVIVLAILAAAAFMAWKLSKNNGSWRGNCILPETTNYKSVYLNIGLTALTMLVALVAGATVAYYAIFVLVIWLFCLVVYYTVRMM